MHLFLQYVLWLCQQAEQNACNFVCHLDCDIYFNVTLLINRIGFISSCQLGAISGDSNKYTQSNIKNCPTKCNTKQSAEEQKTNLMSLAILFHFLCAQHASDINISIIRSLRLFC